MAILERQGLIEGAVDQDDLERATAVEQLNDPVDSVGHRLQRRPQPSEVDHQARVEGHALLLGPLPGGQAWHHHRDELSEPALDLGRGIHRLQAERVAVTGEGQGPEERLEVDPLVEARPNDAPTPEPHFSAAPRKRQPPRSRARQQGAEELSGGQLRGLEHDRLTFALTAEELESNERHHVSRVRRLLNEDVDAHHARQCLDVAAVRARQEQHRGLGDRPLGAELRHEGDPLAGAEIGIYEHDVWGRPPAHQFDPRGAAWRARDIEAIARQGHLQDGPGRLVGVDDQRQRSSFGLWYRLSGALRFRLELGGH